MNKIKEQLLKERKPVHDKCRGEGFTEEQRKFMLADKCERIEPVSTEDGDSYTHKACVCSAYVNPGMWWRHGRCPVGNHYRPDLEISKKKIRVGQQKQRKRW